METPCHTIAVLWVCSGPNVNFADQQSTQKNGGRCSSRGKLEIDHLNSKSPGNFAAIRQGMQENSEAQDLPAFLQTLLR